MPTDKHDLERAQKYVEAHLDGRDPRSAARYAGYADSSKIADLTRPGSPISNAMQKALEARGITDEYIANEIAKGLDAALQDGADKKDCNAHAKYLGILGNWRGYHAQRGPAVAVQINNGSQTGGVKEVDVAAANAALDEARSILGLIREIISERDAAGLHAGDHPVAGGDQLHADVNPHQGVGEVGGESGQVVGGSQP